MGDNVQSGNLRPGAGAGALLRSKAVPPKPSRGEISKFVLYFNNSVTNDVEVIVLEIEKKNVERGLLDGILVSWGRSPKASDLTFFAAFDEHMQMAISKKGLSYYVETDWLKATADRLKEVG